MNLRKLLSAFLVFALMCTLFVPCVSAQESTREIPFALYKECRVSCFYTDINHEIYLVKSREELDSVLDLVDQNDVTSVLPESERDVKYTDAFFEKKAVIIGLYTFGSGSYRHSIENLFVTGDTLYVSRSVFFPEMGTCDEQCRFALMEVALSDIEGVTTVEDFFPGDVIVAEIKSVYGLRGDTDNDDKINVRDATLVQKSLVSLHSFSSADELKADANADGEISIRDATEIQKYSAGFELSSGIGYLVAIYEGYTPDLQQALSELYEMIGIAEDANPPGSNYVAATVQRLFDEIDKARALYESDNPAYEDVVAQTKALEAAIEGLEVVNLDTSKLVPLMNRAQYYIDNEVFYTQESMAKLKEACFMGQMACLYGQSQAEVEEAISAIKEAIDNRVLVYDETERYIYYTIADECRIWDSPSYETKLYLVKSPAQMDEILDTFGDYKKPVRDEKYNEAFFEENSLIISLNIVGGSDCFQCIDDLMVKGDTLTVIRTIYQTENPTPDMNYQYVLIEVQNSDIEGVTILEDNTSYYGDDDDPSPDTTITVYFENKLEWSDVAIHYWGKTESTNWPGKPMNILCQSSNGYDLYCFEIPSDTEGIVFDSPSDDVQTEDMVALFDDMLCYPTNMTAFDRWNVWAVDINEVDIFPKPPTEEPTIPPAPAEIGMEFAVLQESRVWGWGELYEEEHLEIYLATSSGEMDEILSRVRGGAQGTLEAKPVRDEKFDAEYFAENSLIIALVPLVSGSYTQDVKKLTVEDNVLTIHTYINTPFASTCDMNYRYLLIEVKADAVEDVEAFDYAFEYRYIGEQ